MEAVDDTQGSLVCWIGDECRIVVSAYDGAERHAPVYLQHCFVRQHDGVHVPEYVIQGTTGCLSFLQPCRRPWVAGALRPRLVVIEGLFAVAKLVIVVFGPPRREVTCPAKQSDG